MSTKEIKKVLRSDLEIPIEVESRISDTLVSLGADPIQAAVINKPRRMRPVRRTLLVAAVLVFVLSATALAASPELREAIFGVGVRDMVINDGESTMTVITGEGEVVDIPIVMMSMQGFPDSPEFKAAEEWEAFRESYDEDGAILRQVGNGPTGLNPVHEIYGAYTQEMADKIDEIAAKYGLSLFELPFHDYYSKADMFRAVGAGEFLGSEHSPNLTGYMFGRGAFQFEGSANLISNVDGRNSISNKEYVLRYSQKGVLDYVFINIGSADDFTEWVYEAACGTSVLLANGGPHHSFIFADLDNAFIVVIVFGDASQESLEMLADTIDFSMLERRNSQSQELIGSSGSMVSDGLEIAGSWRFVRAELFNGTALVYGESATFGFFEETSLAIVDEEIIIVFSMVIEDGTPSVEQWHGRVVEAGGDHFLVSDITVTRDREVDSAVPVDFQLILDRETGELVITSVFSTNEGLDQIFVFFER